MERKAPIAVRLSDEIEDAFEAARKEKEEALGFPVSRNSFFCHLIAEQLGLLNKDETAEPAAG